MIAQTKPRKRKKPNLRDQCDVVFSKIVRSVGYCQSGRDEHAGALQCAHGWSRSYKAVRWDRRQCWALCQGCHVFFTHRPIEWDNWMRKTMGDQLYAEIRRKALTYEQPDLQRLLSELKSEWKKLAA